jgi:hypothetical protein
VLHELATLKLPFLDDWHVKQFDLTDSELQISVTTSSRFLNHHVSENIRDLLQRDPKLRPRTSELCPLFDSYSSILSFTCAQSLTDSPTYLEYTKWKELVRESAPHKLLFQSALATALNEEVSGTLAITLKNEMIQRFIETLAITLENEMIQRFIDEESRRDPLGGGENNGKNGDEDIFTLLLCRLGDSLMKEYRYDDVIVIYSIMMENRVTLLAFNRLSKAFILKGDLDEVCRTYRAINTYPPVFWLQRDFCEFHLMRTDWQNDIELCKKGMKELPGNLWPMLLLSNLYAEKENYTKAIGIWEQTRIQYLYAQDNLLFPGNVLPWDSERKKFAAALLSTCVLK